MPVDYDALALEVVKSYLSYDKDTGLFTWIKRGKGIKIGSVAGYKTSQGYIDITLSKKHVRAGRLAILMTEGKWPDGHVDHINGVRDDNRLCNLRVVSNQGNMQNRRNPLSNNTSGFLGVAGKNRHGKYRASITVDGKRISLGSFDKAEEAHAVYVAAKRKLHPTCSI